MKNKNITKILITLSLFIFVFGMGFKIGEYKTLLNTSSQSGNKNIDFNLFWQTWDRLEEKYVDQKKIDPAKMFYGAIKGMVASVGDPYTFFLTPEENKDAKDDLTKIGVQVNGKLRGEIEISKDASQEEALKLARANENVMRYLAQGQVVKEIYVSGRIVGFVVK